MYMQLEVSKITPQLTWHEEEDEEEATMYGSYLGHLYKTSHLVYV